MIFSLTPGCYALVLPAVFLFRPKNGLGLGPGLRLNGLKRARLKNLEQKSL